MALAVFMSRSDDRTYMELIHDEKVLQSSPADKLARLRKEV